MILRVNRFSFFLPLKAFRECEAKGRLTFAKRKAWVFIPTQETLFKRKYTDVLGKLQIALQCEANELIQAIIEECEKYKYATSLLCNDGIFIHPEIFGRIALKLSKRFDRMKGYS